MGLCTDCHPLCLLIIGVVVLVQSPNVIAPPPCRLAHRNIETFPLFLFHELCWFLFFKFFKNTLLFEIVILFWLLWSNLQQLLPVVTPLSSIPTNLGWNKQSIWMLCDSCYATDLVVVNIWTSKIWPGYGFHFQALIGLSTYYNFRHVKVKAMYTENVQADSSVKCTVRPEGEG